MTVTEKIWTDYHRKLLSFVRSRVNDNAIAEDILQEIFIKIHTKIDSLKENIKLESWLYQIARNTVYDYYRTFKKSEPLPEGLKQHDIDDNDLAKQELASCLEPMIHLLSDKYRDSVYLSEIAGLTQKEVADKQGISLSGAKSRIQRGRVILKSLMHECCEIDLNKKNQIVDYAEKKAGTDYC